jgi:hypothetical protein
MEEMKMNEKLRIPCLLGLQFLAPLQQVCPYFGDLTQPCVDDPLRSLSRGTM